MYNDRNEKKKETQHCEKQEEMKLKTTKKRNRVKSRGRIQGDTKGEKIKKQ